MYKANEQVAQSGLYRCTTCGITIPMNAGESLSRCPTGCADAIWTFFDEKWHAPAGETREVLEPFPGLDLTGDPQQMPAGARLTDVQPGDPHEAPSLAAFRYDGRVYFASARELFQKTKAAAS